MAEHYNDTVGVTGSSPVPPTISSDSPTFWVYIIQNLTGTYYVGHTDDLDQRLHFHNTGQSHFTARKGPWTLVYSEPYGTRSEAMAREKEIKSWKSRKMIQALIDAKDRASR